MARKVISSQNITDTTSSIQFVTSAEEHRVFAITMKARIGNTGPVYIGTDSAAKSSGFELLKGDREDWVFHPLTVAANTFWVFGTSSGDKLDFMVVRED